MAAGVLCLFLVVSWVVMQCVIGVFPARTHFFSCLVYANRNRPGLEVIKLEDILKLKIKRNDWLLADTACLDTDTWSKSLRFILSLRMSSNFITSRPDLLC